MAKGHRSREEATPFTIHTKGEKLWLDQNDFLRSEVLPVYLTKEHAIETIKAMKKLTKGEKRPVLVDMRNAIGTSNAARNCYAGKEGAEVITACAMLISSPLSKIMGNFYLGLNKPIFPFKLFTNEKKALFWLSQFVET